MGYNSKMDDFLKYVGERKAALLQELHDLESAERLYRESREKMSATQGERSRPEGRIRRVARPSIKKAVMIILRENPRGLTAREILSRIYERWGWRLERTSLSPQLSRLREERRIKNRDSIWTANSRPIRTVLRP